MADFCIKELLRMSKFVPRPPEATQPKGEPAKEKKRKLTVRERAQHKQKIMVTWFLVFVFGITSVGFIVGIGGGRRGRPPVQNRGPQQVSDEETLHSEIKHWREEVEKDPNTASNWATLAYYFEKAKMDSDAIAHYRKAIQLDDRYVFAYAHLGGIYVARKDYKEGIEILEKALKKTDPKDSGNAQIYEALALGYLGAKNLALAHEAIDASIEKYPQEYKSYVFKMRLYESVKDYKKAIEVGKTGLKVATAMSDPTWIQRFQLELEVANQLMKPKKADSPSPGAAAVTPSP
jgi:tetratricopeptide (TPR) repeat protein